MKAIVMDTSAFIGGYQPQSGEEKYYTVREVLKEIKNKKTRLVVTLAVEDGKIKVMDPPREIVEEVREAAESTGDISQLSPTDIKLLSLALQIKRGGRNVNILTDDYDVQNLAYGLGIEFTPLMEMGIKRVFKWKNVCKGCGKVFPPDYKNKCDVCGSELKKIVIKSKAL